MKLTQIFEYSVTVTVFNSSGGFLELHIFTVQMEVHGGQIQMILGVLGMKYFELQWHRNKDFSDLLQNVFFLTFCWKKSASISFKDLKIRSSMQGPPRSPTSFWYFSIAKVQLQCVPESRPKVKWVNLHTKPPRILAALRGTNFDHSFFHSRPHVVQRSGGGYLWDCGGYS